MHPLFYVMLIAGGAVAHYRGGYDSRNFIEREEPDNEADGIEEVECPVCERSSWMSASEECAIERGGKTFKKCKYGAYNNKACGNRRDCYRGPGEKCTEKMIVDSYGQRCAPTYYCNPAVGLCQGLDYVVDSNLQYYVNPNHRYPLVDRHVPSNANLRYAIRARRQF